jgi:hypothetical protein
MRGGPTKFSPNFSHNIIHPDNCVRGFGSVTFQTEPSGRVGGGGILLKTFPHSNLPSRKTKTRGTILTFIILKVYLNFPFHEITVRRHRPTQESSFYIFLL